MTEKVLSEREELILRTVIHHYILTAKPVGSRIIAKKYNFGFSPATIRNTMSDLEDAGYLNHPHTSAGRIPTSMGYRFYVNELMKVEKLTSNLRQKIRNNVDSLNKNIDDLLNKTSHILGKISRQLGVVIGPSLESAIIDKISLLSVSSGKLLIIITLHSGIIKSIVVEINTSLEKNEIDETCQILNERLSGLTVLNIIQTISERLHDVGRGSTEIIRLFIDSAHRLFQFDEKKIYIGSPSYIVDQPEFNEQKNIKGVIELVEQKDVIIHLLSRHEDNKGLVIKIGDEITDDIAKSFSIVSTEFSIGNQIGTLGVIGPMRMWYPKMVPLVDYTAEVINKVLKKEN